MAGVPVLSSLLAWIFLDEPLSARALLGMTLAAIGALLVQIRRQPNY